MLRFKRWVLGFLLSAAVFVAFTTLLSSLRKQEILAEQRTLLSVARQYPKFTLAQRLAVLHEKQSERHPNWRDLTPAQVARRFLVFVASVAGSSQPQTAPFTGNLTAIAAPATNVFGIARQPSCSLTMEWYSYTLSLPDVSIDPLGSLTNYDQTLHNAAGLKTTGGIWPSGCADPTIGITAMKALPVGVTSTGVGVGAGAGYASPLQEQVIYSGMGNPYQAGSIPITETSISGQSPVGLAAADLNHDGNNDLVAVNEAATTGGAGSVSVLLGNADGSFKTPVNYPLPGAQGVSAVIDDFNGDGILDIVASSLTESSVASISWELTFLAGKGDGTFQAPQSVVLTPPSGVNGAYYGIVSADLLHNGKKDLVTSAGVILLGNGDGTFNQSADLAFTTPSSTSEWGPNVVAADFNNDGKLDLAVDDGQSIAIYLGKDGGTFTAGNAYGTIDNVGYLTATDLDGDGNIDLYTGIARSGYFGGDQFEINQGYALMGNGDGTFSGAPELPFAFNGTNMADLNGDKILDGVGLNATLNSTNVSFTSYLGNGNGTFKTGSTLQISPITVQGNPVSFETLDSFGLGSTRGNGIADLVYLPSAFYWPGGVTGFLLASGNGDGSFNAPVFVQAPTFAPSGDFDQSEQVGDLFVADVNGDGKADLIYNYSVEVYQTGIFEQGIAIQLSDGDGSFQNPQVIQTYSSTTAPTNGAPFVVQLGDATGSGKLDLFTETFNSSTATVSLQLYLGNGDGTFGSALTPPIADNIGTPSFGSVLGQIALADMNGDGKPDLITLGSANNINAELAISIGNGDGTFQKPTILDFGSGSSLGYGLAAADFNGDGKIDVAVTGFNPPFDTGIFLGNGDGTVQAFTSGSGAVEPSQAIYLLAYGSSFATDINGDGKPDLVAGTTIFLNQASASNTSPLPTSTALSVSAGSITAGQNETFTATVSASATPTGSVTFYDGSTALATETLNNAGIATYSTTSLAVGTHSILASYLGNSSFASSTSSATTVTVNGTANPTFALSNSGNIALTPGSATGNTSTITVTPSGGFTGSVTLSASLASSPSGAVDLPTLSFGSTSPVNITGTSAGTATLTVTTTPATSAYRSYPTTKGSSWRRASGAALAGILLFGLAARRRSWKKNLGLLIAILFFGGGLVSCGGGSSGNGGGGNGNPGTTAGTYTITVTGTSGSTTETTTVTLNVS